MIAQQIYSVGLVIVVMSIVLVEGGQFISFANSDFELPPSVQERPKLPTVIKDRERLFRLCRFLKADTAASNVMNDKIKKNSVNEALSFCSTLFG